MNNVIDFAKQEIPLYIKEYLEWSFYDNLFDFIIWGIIFILSIKTFYILKKIMNKTTDRYDLYDDLYVFCLCIGMVLNIILFVISFFVVINSMKKIIKIKYSPKYYIISEFKK